VLVRRGGRGAGGFAVRLGRRAGNGSERVAPPRALAAWLARGWPGGRGLVADRKASRRRPLGWGLEQGLGLVPLGPRPWTGRQARAAGGHPQAP
jgi:hypothetical protein